jgi:hypothetical protein
MMTVQLNTDTMTSAQMVNFPSGVACLNAKLKALLASIGDEISVNMVLRRGFTKNPEQSITSQPWCGRPQVLQFCDNFPVSDSATDF